MKRKEQYADEIIEMLERTKCGAWASNINLNTKDRVIEVCQNCVDSWSGRKFKDHCTTSPQALDRTRWIPIERELPEIQQDVLLSLRSLDIEVGFRAKTEPYFYCHGVNGYYIEPQNVLAWMPLPQPYKPQEMEE